MNTKYHTFWRRFFAGWCDGLIFLPLGIVNVFIKNLDIPVLFIIVWLFVYVFAVPVYTILMHGRFGQTLGKMATGIIVLHVSENRIINYEEAVIRESPNLIGSLFFFVMTVYLEFDTDAFTNHAFVITYGILSSANAIWFLVEIITMFSNKKRRALHDYLAHSVVIRKEAFIIPELELEMEAGYQHNKNIA